MITTGLGFPSGIVSRFLKVFVLHRYLKKKTHPVPFNITPV